MRFNSSTRRTPVQSKVFSLFSSTVIGSVLLALSLSFYGCSQQTPLEPTQNDQTAGQQVNDPNVIPGQYIVVLKSTNEIAKHNGLMKRVKQDITVSALNAGVKPVRVYSSVVHGYSATLTEGQYQLLMNDPAVDYIEPDRPVHMIAQTVPWGINAVNAPVAHARGTKGSGVKVGIIDTGIDHGHPDLAANYVSGIDFVNNDNDPLDDNGHGSHVSGTVAAIDNTIGVIGVAPSASLYGIKVLDAAGSGTFSNVVAGIDWAAANGMNVVNMSLGASIGTAALQTACDNAFAAGVVICAAAGNDFGGPVGYPAKYSSAIAVSAVDQNNNLANFSNQGPEVEVTAPGVGVFSTYKNGQYATLDGTSMATPHAAGVCALIWSTGQFTTATAVRNQLTSTATDIGAAGRDNKFGFGLINADAATNVGPPPNQAPTANANGPYSGQTGSAIAFSSAGSSDADGTIAGYSWDFGDGSAASSLANPSHSYALAGTYTATLTVTDDQGATGSNSATVTITDPPPPNQAPTANANGPYTGTEGSAVAFSSVGSSDIDGTIVGYSWSFGDGATSAAANPSHTYALAGTYTVSLTVTDNQGATGSNGTTATISAAPPGNQAPTANANGPYAGETGVAVAFSSAGSVDPDGTIAGYSWDFGDGSTSALANPSHAYALAGPYTATLTVTDNQGATGSNSAAVTITDPPPPNQAPTAVVNGPYSGVAGAAVSFSSTGSSDIDGTIVGFSWNFGDGSTSAAANPSHTYATAGTYTVTLTVTDNQGATGSASTTATITGGGTADNVTIDKAVWKNEKQQLKVIAFTDDLNATLTLVGYGTMQPKGNGEWQLKVKNVTSNPGSVTVTSSSGGSATKTVKTD